MPRTNNDQQQRLVYSKDNVSVNAESADNSVVGYLSIVEHVLFFPDFAK